ncbi:hypothetical protein G9A89_000520 [Geosiphon pyriformis]|nr:hypothetical protein G9A89_000520 [Geosiphon pyriformis]
MGIFHDQVLETSKDQAMRNPLWIYKGICSHRTNVLCIYQYKDSSVLRSIGDDHQIPPREIPYLSCKALASHYITHLCLISMKLVNGKFLLITQIVIRFTNNLRTCTQLIPEKHIQEAPTTYPFPTISLKRVRDYQDDESADVSYGSLLTTGTEISMLTNDDISLNNLPIDFQYNSYAEVASGTSITIEETQISSPSASAYAEWITEK